MASVDDELRQMGRLHDAVLETIEFDKGSACAHIRVDDLYSAYEGLPEYRGPAPGKIVCREVRRIEIALDVGCVGLMILQASIELAEGQSHLEVRFSPSGHIRVECSSATIEGATGTG